MPERRFAPLAIDLVRAQRRSVTSLYSNLVTRPTGRAIRMGVESQLAELSGEMPSACLSVLDFSGVRVLDYSCADEIVAKLLLRYGGVAPPAQVYFVVRGVQDHHEEAIEAVLERHDLLVVAEDESGAHRLLGTTDPLLRSCWSALLRLGRTGVTELATVAGTEIVPARDAANVFCDRRVALRYSDDTVIALPLLLQV